MSNVPPYPGNQPPYPGNQPPYPGGPPPYPGGPPVPAGRTAAPQSVLNAVKLMRTGAVLSVVGALVGILTSHKIRTLLEKARPQDTVTQINRGVHLAVAVLIIGGLIDAGLWLWMSVANGRGHNWARITGTVFFGVNTLGLLVSFAQHTTVLSKLVAVLVWLVGLTTVVFLWQRDSNAFFHRPPEAYYQPYPQNPYYQ